MRKIVLVASFLSSLAIGSFALGETTVTVEKSHLCCGKCVAGAKKAVESVDGAKADIDQKADKITIKAANDAEAQKAVDALSAAGFFGTVSSGKITDDSGAPSGKVKSLEVTTHNCCQKCTTAINKVIKSVPGAAGEAEAKKDTFTVTGDYDAAALVKAFNEAGFSVKVASK